MSNSFISNWTEIIKQLQFLTAMAHKQLFFITVLYKLLHLKFLASLFFPDMNTENKIKQPLSNFIIRIWLKNKQLEI